MCKLLSAFYVLLTCVIVVAVAQQVRKDPLAPQGLFLATLAGSFILAGLLHFSEFHVLIYGLVYIFFIPIAYLLLPVYSFLNLNVMSWGTRVEADTEAFGCEDPGPRWELHQPNRSQNCTWLRHGEGAEEKKEGSSDIWPANNAPKFESPISDTNFNEHSPLPALRIENPSTFRDPHNVLWATFNLPKALTLDTNPEVDKERKVCVS